MWPVGWKVVAGRVVLYQWRSFLGEFYFFGQKPGALHFPTKSVSNRGRWVYEEVGANPRSVLGIRALWAYIGVQSLGFPGAHVGSVDHPSLKMVPGLNERARRLEGHHRYVRGCVRRALWGPTALLLG